MFPSRWNSLRARMTIAYVSVTVGPVLSFLLLTAIAAGIFSAFVPASDALSSEFITAIQEQARTYAMSAAFQAQGQGAALDPSSNFIPGQAHTIAVAYSDRTVGTLAFAPYLSDKSLDPTSVAVALLVAPDGCLVASSYPARYPAGMRVSTLASAQSGAIEQALGGRTTSGTERLSSVTLGYAVEPVWGQNHQPIGAIFLQVPGPQRDSFLSRLLNVLWNVLVLLLVVTPLGIFFGWITTRGLVGRVQRLVVATFQFAGGDYSQRVASAHSDEIGQLERQFNQMAEQLAENTARRQQLAEQNARLEERARISRELHDAVSQDLFSLRMLANGLREAARASVSAAELRPQIALLEDTMGSMTREMRALLLELRPTELEQLGLAGALRKLAESYRTRLGIAVTAELQPVALDVRAEHALLRIAQESLANAARHSSASHITLSLASDDRNWVRLEITDNGEGFTAEDNGTARHGLGLRIMRERVEELHGTLELATAPGEGARIAVVIPQEHADD